MQSYRVLAVITLVSALAWSCQQPNAGKSTTVNPDDEIVRLNGQLQTSPDSPELHHQLALMLAIKGDWGGSDKEMSTAIRLDPHNPILFIEAAQGYRARGLRAKAIEMLTRAVAIDRQNPLSHFSLGLMYERESNPDKAMAEFRETKRLIDTLSLPTSAPDTRNRIIKGTQGETWYRDQFGKDYLLNEILESLRKKLA
jgi:cytochrome c-type biogenesis protein CcmH/NrfG